MMQWWEKALDFLAGAFGIGGIVDQFVTDKDASNKLKASLESQYLTNMKDIFMELSKEWYIKVTLCLCLLSFVGILNYLLIMGRDIPWLLVILVLIGYGGNFQFTAQLVQAFVDLLTAFAKFGTALVNKVTPETKQKKEK